MLCSFLPYINMDQPLTYLCSLPLEPPSHLPPPPTPLGCHRSLNHTAIVLIETLHQLFRIVTSTETACATCAKYLQLYGVFSDDLYLQNYQFSSVTQSCLTLCYPMDSSTTDLPVLHQLLELAQTHVH